LAARANSRRAREVQTQVRLTAALERALADDLEKIFNSIARRAARLIRENHQHTAVNVPQHFAHDIARAIRARSHIAAVTFAKHTLAKLTGTGKAFSPVEEAKFLSLFQIAEAAILRWLTDHGAEKVRRIVETTRNTIRKALIKGNEEHEPPRVLAKRIQADTGGEIGRRRAVTIARTETGQAASVGSNAAAEATGLDLDKVWNATEDARTRPDHAAADGQTVDMDADFIVGGESMKFPRAPGASARQCINCRCICTYEPRLPK